MAGELGQIGGATCGGRCRNMEVAMVGRWLLFLPCLALAGWIVAAPAEAGAGVPERVQLAGWLDDLFSNAPGGSYRSSCRDERVKNHVLTAECRRDNGDYRKASLDLRNCDGNIRNDNGKLACEKSGNRRSDERVLNPNRDAGKD
jgi:hypothetical protein